MMITRKAIARRTVLRGIGATMALPLLDGMVPALSALAQTPESGMAPPPTPTPPPVPVPPPFEDREGPGMGKGRGKGKGPGG